MTVRIAVLSLVCCLSLVVGCGHRPRVAPEYATLDVSTDEWDVWLASERGGQTRCPMPCSRSLPLGAVRIGVAEHGSRRPDRAVGLRLTEPTHVTVGRNDREGVRIGGGVLLGFGVASLAGELGVMIPSFQNSRGGWDGFGLGLATFGWSVVTLALTISGATLLSVQDAPTLETEPTFVPWGAPVEGGAVGGVAGTW